MVCHTCSSDTKVINSRLQKRSNQVWRRRQCLSCSLVFTTHEISDLESLWRIKDRQGALTSFNRDKLFMSLYRSLQHRPTALTDAGDLANTVITKLSSEIRGGLINPLLIIQIVIVTLHRFDSLASAHYQAYHKQ